MSDGNEAEIVRTSDPAPGAATDRNAVAPDGSQRHYRQAQALVETGQFEEARRYYLLALEQAPGHFGVLNDFANLLVETGYHSAAATAYLQAIKVHPDRPESHVNLANLLLSQGRTQEAKEHYLAALRLDPDLAEAHRGLSYALTALGEEADAARHREPGFRGRAVLTWPHRGPGPKVPIVLLSSAIGGNIPLKHVLDSRIFQTTVLFAEYFEPATPLPAHALVFNTIGDADLSGPGLDAAEAVLAQTTAPVINPPAAIRATGRRDVARRLGGLPGVITPRIALLPRETLPDQLVGMGIGFPVLLRSPGFHTGQHFVRVDGLDDLPQAVAGLPGRELLALDYLDARNRQGDSHKFRVMFVGGVLYPLHLAFSKSWKVHYFSADMATQAAYRAREAAFLDDMPSVLGPRVMAALESVRRTLGLDYGGMDFALDPDGNVLLFEANATMVVYRPGPGDHWDYRRPAADRILSAIQSLVLGRIG